MGELRSGGTITAACTYHAVWCTKYRRPVLETAVAARLEEIITEVCAGRGADITELEILPDRVRLVVTVEPRYGIHRLVKAVKGRSSHLLRAEYPALRSRLPTLWTASYFVATAGDPDEQDADRYAESQRYA